MAPSYAIECEDTWLAVDGPWGGETEVTVGLRYDTTDPYSATMSFHDDQTQTWTVWEFARDLFAAGLGTHAGMGDVQVWPDAAGNVYVALHSPEGDMCFVAPRRQIEWFVKAAFALVPRRKEAAHLGLDAELAAFVEEGSGGEVVA